MPAMAQAPTYTQTTDFSDEESANVGGRSTVRTAALDAELTAIASSINALRSNQSLNQRDDGEIRDGRVKLFTLSADVLALMTLGNIEADNVRGAWLTATAYVKLDLVTQGGNTYICAVAHTSGTFSTDLAAVRWILVSQGATASASIAFTPTATIAATDVQAAIDEADTENRALSAAASALATANDAAIRADLASTSDAAKGDALLGVKRTFTNSVAGTAHSVHEAQVINAVAYAGMSTAGSAAANTTALGVCLAAAVALGGATIEIPAGSYALTAGTNWAAASVTIRGQGGPAILTFAASGNAFVMDSGGSGTVIYGMGLENLRIVGNAATTNGFYSRGMVHSSVKNVEVRECATRAFYIMHGVDNYYETCTYSTNRAAQTTKPTIGWELDNSGPGYYTANCTFDNCVAEGFTGTGLKLTDASGNLWCGGTFEGVTGTGVNISADDCRRNHFINVWFEANTVNDVIVKGVANQFTACYFGSNPSGNCVDITTGTGTVFNGGFAVEIALGASSSDTVLNGVGTSDNGALGITGTGTHKRVGCTKVNGSGVITGKWTDVLGPSATWTPTVAQTASITGLTISKNTYRINGSIANVRAKIICGSAGTASAAVVVGGIPAAVAILAADIEMPIGRFVFFDSSASTYYEGSVVASSTSAVTLQTNNVTNAFGTAPAVTIASGDVIYVFMDYEIA